VVVQSGPSTRRIEQDAVTRLDAWRSTLHATRPAAQQALMGPPFPPCLLAQTARDVRFRHNFGAALLSVHRSGTAVTGDVAAIKLQVGYWV
jgi:hypothetical protein